ncbi:winged helix-turn-helix domain-containing protein [Streptomyces sp. VRA16 Mangrove soil]|uniref:winged helix-turn-helix domain-containing protein n=1 Tax=Streptomyces sp. VRA16 Mangrove soil TaxID=2817434 RepID=UPI001A9FB5D0|nr:winged helix-turn-helix domain-containing protein [Streptomyces sp. VRA16 Mangrove soil]MBO1337489.1 GntR family transcriptional regulator [Streptomyces sp. VRA16 Mangrove soil]
MGAENAVTPEQIAAELSRWIESGRLQGGERLPTQADLADQFGVERSKVRQALEQLKSDGLLTNVGRGSPPTVAPGKAVVEADPSRAARSVLVTHLSEVLKAPEVQIDAVSLTAETLMLGFGEMMTKFYEQTLQPRVCRVRVMLPRADERLDYPAPEGGWGPDPEMDEAVDRRNRLQGEAHRIRLQQMFARLRSELKIDAQAEFRSLRGTPVRKTYLFNRQVLLLGHYIPGRFMRDVYPYEELKPLRDVDGAETAMYVFERGVGGRDQLFVQSEQLMFDHVWDHVAQPLG